MLTEIGYITGWAIYLTCSLILFFGLNPILKWFKFRFIQLFFKTLIFAVLFTPIMAVPEQSLWAPANITAVFSYVQGDELQATQAGLFILVAWCCLGLLASLLVIFRKLTHTEPKPVKKKRSTEAPATSSRTKTKQSAVRKRAKQPKKRIAPHF